MRRSFVLVNVKHQSEWRCVRSIKTLTPSVDAERQISAASWVLIELPEVISPPICLQSAGSDCGPSPTNHLRRSDGMEGGKNKESETKLRCSINHAGVYARAV